MHSIDPSSRPHRAQSRRISAWQSVFAAAVIATSLPLSASAAMVSAQDSSFVTHAAQAGMAEVSLAKLAMQTSHNSTVLSFAREMSADHSKANAQLMTIAQQKSIAPPTQVAPKDAALMQKLSSLSGAAFDTLYLKSQVAAHRKALTLFKTEASNGSDSDLVAFAKQTIPVITAHLAMDRRDVKTIARTSMSATSAQ